MGFDFGGVSFAKFSREIIGTLRNLFNTPVNERYFFSNLKQINWIEPLNEAGFFDPRNNPKPKPTEDGNGYMILYWEALTYLKWVSENFQTDEKIVKELAKIIDAITNYRDKDGKIIKNYRTDFHILKMLNKIPSNYIKDGHIDFIKDSLEVNYGLNLISSELSKGFILKLITDDKKELLLELVDVICSYRILDYYVNPLIEEYWFAKLIKKHKTELAKYSAKEIIEKIVNVIKEVRKEDHNSFNIVRIPKIESHGQKTFSNDYEAQLIDLLVECLLYLNEDILIEKVKELLNNEFDILKRVGIHLVNIKFKILGGLFFELGYNPLEDYKLRHETYELIKSNVNGFSRQQIDIIVKWIEENDYAVDETKPHKEQQEYLALYKKSWYKILLPCGYEDIKEKYNKYNRINKGKRAHPGFPRWMEFGTGEITPLQEFQIEKSTIDEILTEIRKFKEEKGFGKPTVRGFADTIQKDVEKNPSKYYESLEKFKDIDLAYLCTIISAFINISRNNNQAKKEIFKLGWDKILKFIDGQLNKSFWKLKYSGEFNYRDWFISEVANLIEEGTKQDETAFDTKLLPIAKKILLNLTQHTIFYSIDNEDYVNFALNSTEGKILDAMFNYSLRFYRIVGKKWDDEIKKHFIKRVTEKKYLEVFTIIGQYLPQFFKLDKEWVESNFDLIFPVDNLDILKASSSGLFFNPIVYSDFYNMFKEKGLYKLFLDSWGQNGDQINKDLLMHICLGYAEKWEEIEDGTLMKELLEKLESLDEVVRFFWISSKNIKPDYVIRIKELWRYIYNNNKGLQITGKLMQWLRVFDELDEDLFNLCLSGVKFVDTHDVYYVIEYLVKYIDSDVEKVGKILLELVKNVEIVSEYRKEDVIKIVEKLYSEGKKDLANRICEKYSEQSLLFLREVYDKYNN